MINTWQNEHADSHDYYPHDISNLYDIIAY